MLAERDDVDGSLGAKTRAVVGAAADEPAPPPPKRSRKAHAAKPSGLQALLERVPVDRSLFLVVATLIVIVGSALHVGSTLGVVGAPEVRALTKAELSAMSPLLTGALLEEADSRPKVRGWVSSKRWAALDGRRRHAAADALARKLAAADIPTADVYAGNKMVIVIRNGTLISAEGSKL
jgi:hypothetical protein